MKVIFVICFLQVSYSITVPPAWTNNGRNNLKTTTIPTIINNEQLPPLRRIQFKAPAIPTTIIPINSEQFTYHSFFPPDAQPKGVSQLKYRSPNNQNIFVFHPPTNENKKNVETPQSYQIVHFDNEKDVSIIQQIKDEPINLQRTNNPPIKQHLTEVIHPVRYNNEGAVEASERDVQTKSIKREKYPQNFNNKQIHDSNFPREESGGPVYPGNEERNVEESEEIRKHDLPTIAVYPGTGQRAKYEETHNNEEINAEEREENVYDRQKDVSRNPIYEGKRQRPKYEHKYNNEESEENRNHDLLTKTIYPDERQRAKYGETHNNEEINVYDIPKEISKIPIYTGNEQQPKYKQKHNNEERNEEINVYNIPKEVSRNPIYTGNDQRPKYKQKNNNEERNEELNVYNIPKEVSRNPIYTGNDQRPKYKQKNNNEERNEEINVYNIPKEVSRNPIYTGNEQRPKYKQKNNNEERNVEKTRNYDVPTIPIYPDKRQRAKYEEGNEEINVYNVPNPIYTANEQLKYNNEERNIEERKEKQQQAKYDAKHNNEERKAEEREENEEINLYNIPKEVSRNPVYTGKRQRPKYSNEERTNEEQEEIRQHDVPIYPRKNQRVKYGEKHNNEERNAKGDEENEEIRQLEIPRELFTKLNYPRTEQHIEEEKEEINEDDILIYPRKGQRVKYDNKHKNEENEEISDHNVPREDNGQKNSEETKEKEKISEHEIPREVPTRPIYPGEGQWAKYGQKHRPYIQSHKSKQENEEISEEEKPEGYETFDKGAEQFHRSQQDHHHNINTFPEQHQLTPSKITETASETEPLYKKPEIGFVPEKLYTQVRRTETKQHLPRSSIDPEDENAARLKEVVKDSKIHTVYTEEGYEDSAYDHAGHEKNAENHEGQARTADDQSGARGRSRGGGQEKYLEDGGRRHGKNNLRRKIENKDRKTNEDYDNSARFRKKSRQLNDDIIETAASNLDAQKVPSKNIKKVTLKNHKNEDIDMEIYTEVKFTPQKKKHKFVKITPVVPTNSTLALKRVKRYNKDKLSKKYVRQRPKYYWKKKNRTTTTERSATKASRLKFEAAFKTYNKLDEPELEPIETTPRTRSSTTVKTSSTSTTTSTAPTILPEELDYDVHPDLLNPEFTTKKPAAPKMLPVKIRKFQIKRQKRYTNDFHKIIVDLKEFKDVNKLSVGTQAPDTTHIKYPYYNLPVTDDLHQDSPLRYAEDMRNIPKKVENELSFYESRDHIVCPEVESTVEPIPERVQKQEEGEETDKMADSPELPRLKGLGDKIDCMKIKYFGKNPLDSPFFNEEIIEEPVPFFTITKHEKNTKKRELKIKILQPIVVLDEGFIESATANPIHKNTEAVLKPPFTLLEMMSMHNEKILTPKSIYDQISLLEQEDKTVSQENNNAPPAEKFIILYDSQEAAKKKANSTTKKPEVTSSTVKPDESAQKPQIRKRPIKTIIRKLPAKNIRKPTQKTTTTSTTTTSITTTTPKATTTSEQSTNIGRSAYYNIFDVSRYLPQVPNHRLITNEAQFKELIKAGEQIKNIRRSEYHNIFDVSRYIPKVQNHRLVTSEAQYKDLIKPSEQMKVYSDVLQNINNEKENKETSDSKPVAVNIPVPEEMPQIEENVQESSEPIVGMMPPSTNGQYKTIDNQEPSEIQPQNSEHMNYYYFIGMRPPKHHISKRDTSSSKKEDNEDLMMEESQFNYVTSFHRRSKRHLIEDNEEDLQMDGTEIKLVYSAPPQRKPKIYTEIVRQRSKATTEEPEEEEEDLNPRKRIYELKSSTASSTTSAPEDIEEIIEEIVTEPVPTTTSEPVIYPVEANSEDSKIAQYIFFIEKLHNKWAKEDATSTTEASVTTETQTEEIKEAVDKGVPTYLQIINQLHEIRKEEDVKTTTEPIITTTEMYQPMKNSNPFILETFMSELKSMQEKLDPDSTAEGSNIETTRPRNYSTRFQTNIDTSKYKTIERSPITVRHNLSSRFNSDDLELPLQKEKTTQLPMVIAIITKPTTTETPKETTVDHVLEEASNREPVREPSTTQSTITTTVRSRQRGRIRARPTVSTTTAPRPSTSAASVNFRRRRPVRTTTTTQASTTSFNRRRNRQKIDKTTEIPETSTETTTETIVVVTPVNSEEPKKQRRFQKVQERRVMSEVTLTRFYEPSSDELDDNLEETKKHQYEVIGPLTDVETGHGGNYKHEEDRKEANSAEVPSYYTDPTLADNVNKLKDEVKTSSTEKTTSSNLLSQEAKKVAQLAHTKVNLYPNMARMVNRLAEKKSEELTTMQDFEEQETTEEPFFIKDPSRRKYFYAKL